MTDYYIRITDEEPVDMEKGIRFKYNANDSDSEFIVVEENDYRTLVEQFEAFSEDTSSLLNYSLDSIIESKIIPMSERTSSIADDVTDENSEELTYSNLKEVVDNYVTKAQHNTIIQSLESITSLLSQLSSRVQSLDTSKVSLSQVNALLNNYFNKDTITSLLSGKSDTDHGHTKWESITTLGNWDSSVCWLHVNKDIRMCHYHMVLPITSATANKRYEWGSGMVGNIPSAYRPNGTRYGACYTSSGGYGTMFVTSGGKIGAIFSKGWTDSKNVQGDVFWTY